MSSYEDYTRVSRNYDRTRCPVGIEVIIGCMAQAHTPLDEMVVLDAGCGTGNYSRALLDHVGRIVAVDLNEDMIGDAAFDGVMINQVLHRLPDESAQGFSVHRRVFREIAWVLKPGGILTVNTCSRRQLEHGYWYYSLIPQAARTLRARFVPIELLPEILEESGFTYRGRFAPLDALMQGPSYFDPHGPLRKEWRDGVLPGRWRPETSLNRLSGAFRSWTKKANWKTTWHAITPGAKTWARRLSSTLPADSASLHSGNI